MVQSPFGFDNDWYDYEISAASESCSKKKKIHYLLSKIREDKRYFVKFEVYAPGSVLIKARNRNHESCPSSVVERTGAERFHANLKKKRQEVRDFICYFLGESSFAPSRLACML